MANELENGGKEIDAQGEAVPVINDGTILGQGVKVKAKVEVSLTGRPNNDPSIDKGDWLS